MSELHREFLNIVTQVRSHLEYQAALGVRAVATSSAAPVRFETSPPAVVIGEGNPKAAVVFVSAEPRQDKDRHVSVFNGAAGQLLSDIIVKGMKLKREDVYVCCIAGSGTRAWLNPKPDQIAASESSLRKQITAVNPKVVIALGDTAVRALLGTHDGISALRGTWRAYEGIPVMPTFDPAYLLMNPQEKKPAWEDIQKVMAILDLPVRR